MIRRFARRHALALGFVGVLLPLAVLVGLQYSWLADLERASAVAETAYLRNYLDAVSNQVEVFYQKQGERALNLPGAYLEHPHKLAKHFATKRPDGAKVLFAVVRSPGGWERPLVFDGARGEPLAVVPPGLARSIELALAPFEDLCSSDPALRATTLHVDERDPSHRMLLAPITDDAYRLVGVAGMVLDSRYFAEHLLPEAIGRSLPPCASGGADLAERDDLVFAVRDEHGRTVLGPAPPRGSKPVTQRIPFVYSDWELSLASVGPTPEEWARSNFVLNVSLSLLLAGLLLGAVWLALRMASREMRLSRMKSDFVSNVSHELRTPLASIRVFGEFLRLGRVSEASKICEYGEYIETESRRLTGLIDNILDFSKIESGAKTYEFERGDPLEVVEGVLRNLEVALRHRGFELDWQPPATRLPEVELDAAALGQALANLVDNAVKYSRDDKRVTVRAGRGTHEVWISVADRGIGISRDEQRKIFDRFHRVSTGLVHEVRGSGLGLSIVHHVVLAHRGSIEVDSEPGRGSTFTIRLPIAPPEARPLPVPGAPSPRASRSA